MIPHRVLQLIREKHGLTPETKPIDFTAYLVNADGEMKLFGTS